MIIKRLSILTFLFFACCISIPAFAQEGYEHLSPEAHGAGRTYSVTPRGLEAVGLNPALLGIPTSRPLMISAISEFGVDEGPSFKDATALSDIFAKRGANDKINDSIIRHLSNLLTDGSLSGRGDAEVLGIYYNNETFGGIAFTWTTHAGIRADMPQNFVDYFYNATTSFATDDILASNFDLQANWYNEYSISYGLPIIKPVFDSTLPPKFLNRLLAGVAVKYVSGIGYFRLDPSNYFQVQHPQGGGTVVVGADYLARMAYSNSFDPTHSPNRFSLDFINSQSAGSGMGFDIGVAAGLFGDKGYDGLLIGASITDIGNITWNKNTYIREADSVTFTLNTNGATSLKDVSDSIKRLSGNLKKVPSFTTQLPTMLRIGAALNLDNAGVALFGGSSVLAFEYAHGLSPTAGSIESDRFGLGLSLGEGLQALGLREGFGFTLEGGKFDITLAGGVTLFDRLAIDLATAKLTELFKSTGRTDFAIAVKLVM